MRALFVSGVFLNTRLVTARGQVSLRSDRLRTVRGSVENHLAAQNLRAYFRHKKVTYAGPTV
jgi:hypothetical protein